MPGQAGDRGGRVGGGASAPATIPPGRPRRGAAPGAAGRRRRPGRMFTGGDWHERRTATARGTLRPGDAVDRPGADRRGRSPPPWSSPAGRRRSRRGDLMLDPVAPRPPGRGRHRAPTRCMLEIFNNLFMSDRRADGRHGCRPPRTRSTSRSGWTSPARCSTPTAASIANAPHMPVHLGSMGESASRWSCAATAGRMQPGDVYVLNDPYHGGTHLPDITVVTPVFDDAGEPSILFFVGVPRPPRRDRRHHAGLDAGRSAPASTRRACCSTTGCWSRTASCARRRRCELLRLGPYPSRNPGRRTWPTCGRRSPPTRRAWPELRQMVAQFGLDVVQRLHGSRAGQRRGGGAPGHRAAAATASSRYEMDTGAVIKVAVTVDQRGRGRARSTSPAPQPSCRATSTRPSSVAMAAVLYVFRTLVDDDIPLNAGCLKPLQVVIPRGLDARPGATRPRWWPATWRPPRRSPARCTRALGMQAEGSGHHEQRHLRQRASTSTTRPSRAAPAPGTASTAPSVVQTHMTNSRLTDPEVLEWRFPVLLESVRDPARQRRRGPVAGRRRRRPPDPVPRADDGEHAEQSPAGPAVRHGGRGPGPARATSGWNEPTARVTELAGLRSRRARARGCLRTARPRAAAGTARLLSARARRPGQCPRSRARRVPAPPVHAAAAAPLPPGPARPASRPPPRS